MSICDLNLDNDPAKIEKVKNIMEEIQPILKSISNGQVCFKFERFNFMGNDEAHCRVVYAEMKKDQNFELLNNVINIVLTKLISEGIIDQNELEKYHIQQKNGEFRVLLHLTLLNLTFLNKLIKKKEKFFNAIDTLNNIKAAYLVDCPLNKINFCVKREDKKTEMYELVQPYEI